MTFGRITRGSECRFWSLADIRRAREISTVSNSLKRGVPVEFLAGPWPLRRSAETSALGQKRT